MRISILFELYFLTLLLEFGDPNPFWYDSKSSRCDIYGETKFISFFGFCGRRKGSGYGPFLLITLYIYINAMMYRIYGNDVYVYVVATFISLLYQFLT